MFLMMLLVCLVPCFASGQPGVVSRTVRGTPKFQPEVVSRTVLSAPEPRPEKLIRQLRSASTASIGRACTSLGDRGSHASAPKVRAALEKLTDPTAQAMCLRALGRLDAAGNADFLQGWARDTARAPQTRVAAIETLPRIERPDGGTLASLARDPDEGVRTAGAYVGAIVEAPEVVPAIREMIHADNVTLQQAALVTASVWPEAFAPELAQAARTRTVGLDGRIEALTALNTIAADDASREKLARAGRLIEEGGTAETGGLIDKLVTESGFKAGDGSTIRLGPSGDASGGRQTGGAESPASFGTSAATAGAGTDPKPIPRFMPLLRGGLALCMLAILCGLGLWAALALTDERKEIETRGAALFLLQHDVEGLLTEAYSLLAALSDSGLATNGEKEIASELRSRFVQMGARSMPMQFSLDPAWDHHTELMRAATSLEAILLDAAKTGLILEGVLLDQIGVVRDIAARAMQKERERLRHTQHRLRRRKAMAIQAAFVAGSAALLCFFGLLAAALLLGS